MLKRFTAGALGAVLAFLAGAADVTVTPGGSQLYRDATLLSTHEHVEACIDAALHAGAGAYSCRTSSNVSVAGSANGACGVPDIGGWTRPVPTPLDTSVIPALDRGQSGSRLYYVSSSTGNDQTGEIYFWDGAHVVDAEGNTYGTDPINPSANVKAFRRWSWVGPRYSTSSDIGTPGYVGNQTPTFRSGFPDWWLFRRGDTFDLKADFESFDAEKNQPSTNIYSALNIPGGRSSTERAVVGAYGALCSPRPRFINPVMGFVNRTARANLWDVQHTLYQSLHWDGHARPNGVTSAISAFNYQTAASVDNTLEDVWVDGGGLNIGADNSGQFTLRRVLITDAFMPNNEQHIQGLYYEGTKVGWLRVEDSILLRNGFAHGDPAKLPWPPSGAQTWDIYNRNLYINGEINARFGGFFDSVSMMGASGDQWRAGGRVQRSFFYQGYLSMAAAGGYPDEEGFTGQILNNALQRFTGKGTDDNRGQPNWGLGVAGGAGFVHVAGNIVTGAQWPGASNGMSLGPVPQSCGVPPKYATRKNRIVANVFDSGTASAGLQVQDGVEPGSCHYEALQVPGVTANTMADNVVVNDKLIEHEYLPVGKAPPTNDTAYTGNRVFKTRAEAAAALGWPDPGRTLKTYMQAQGVTVTSADGFPEYFERATKLRRGQWDPKWTARPLVDHVRQGFGMPPISMPATPPTPANR